MSTELLALTQWLSPSFPLGAFAYSHGLEAAIASGHIRNALALERWVADLLLKGSAQLDAVILVHVLRGGDPQAAAATAEALATSAERWEETRDMGAAFARTLAEMAGAPREAHPFPVALGLAARRLNMAPETVAMLFLQSFAANQVGCAQRAIPLGQGAAQGVLHRLSPVIADAASTAAHGDLDRLASCALGADIAAMSHETLQPRMFRT